MNRISLIIKILIFTFALSSCTTFRANIFLYKVTTTEDKALLLYNEGLRLYNQEFLENNNLEIIPKINGYLLDAYKLDPELKESHDLIVELESYRMEELNRNLDIIRELSDITERTDMENYKLVLAIKNANRIGVKNILLKNSTKKFKDLIPEVVLKQENELILREESILTTTDIDTLYDTSRRYKVLYNEIISLDNNNSVALSSVEVVKDHLTNYIIGNLQSVTNLTQEGSYIEAELLVRKTENINKIYNLVSIEEFSKEKFNLFYTWSGALFAQKRYETAKNIGVLAYNIDNSPNVLSLLNRIESAIDSRSFESTISDVLSSIDFYLEKEEPKKALNIINVNYNKFKNQSNRSKLDSKRSSILDSIESIYNLGIEYYRQENFSKALDRFKIVYNYDMEYRDVKNYYDLSNRKVKALSGMQ